MERLTGENKKYAELCLEYGKEPQLEKALEICNKYDDENAADITQRIYRKKINNTLINSGMEFMENNSAKNKLCDIKVCWSRLYIISINIMEKKIMRQMTVAIW